MKEIYKYFSEYIDNLSTPREPACQSAMDTSKAAEGKMWKRDWETIKKKVNYIVLKKRKVSGCTV